MDQHRDHTWTRILSCPPSRRDILRGIAGAGLGFGVARLPEAADARKKRKRKKREKKAKPNTFGCIDVGKACENGKDCCSGICQGKKGKKQCRAHGAGSCQQDTPGACQNGSPVTAICNGDCLCFTTTAGNNFCTNTNPGGSACADCKKDADCVAQGFPAGSACAPFTQGVCANAACETGMTCLVPCGVTPLAISQQIAAPDSTPKAISWTEVADGRSLP